MSQQPIGHAPGNSEKNKWEFKTHSYQIADTGDYDGHYELTNGDITLWTKDDDEETERFLRLAAHFLNKVGINLSDAKVDDLSYQVYLLELEKKQLQERVKELEDKPAGAVWVKASDINIEYRKTYYAKWPSGTVIKATGWFQESDGTFFWNEQGYIPILKNEHHMLLILDESGTAASKDVEKEGGNA